MEKDKKTKENPEDKKEEKPKREFREVPQGAAPVRIISTDIPANLSLYAGLVRIKGISWAVSKAICHALKMDRKRKIASLAADEIARIEEFIKNPSLPEWMLNRRKDPETGESRHLVLTDLDLQREFDVRRMKKMRSYKGIRHMLGQPVRGQRTKAHFRSKGKSVGVTRVKAKPGAKK